MFRFIDLFAGIGGFRLPAEKLSGKCVFSSEWDKFSRQTYEHNFNDVPHGDIAEIAASDIPDFDILFAGFPCQPFSSAGMAKFNSLGISSGFSHPTQGTAFFEVARILKENRPRAFVLENVRNLMSHDKGRTFKLILDTLASDLGYSVHYGLINAKHYVPQNRNRVFIVGFLEDCVFTFPTPPSNVLSVRDILQANVDSKYTLTDRTWAYMQAHAAKHKKKGNGFGFNLVKLDGITRTLLARYYKDGSGILIPQDGQNPRKLTPRECARLMGFPDSFGIPVSNTQAYKQFGNAVSPPVVEDVLRCVLSSLTQ